MTDVASIVELERRLAAWTGLDLGRGVHAYVLHDVIGRRAAARGMSVAAYARAVERFDDPEVAQLIDLVTVCHSWFFRDAEQMAVIERLIADGPPEMRVWLAACAGGEEAYTIAMIAEAVGKPLSILATDINSEALARARAGRYGRWSLKDLPAGFRDRFTAHADGSFEVVPRLRRAVTFERHNLMSPTPAARAEGWDLILCRNVLMYFHAADAHATIVRLGSALRPGGHLILGASDILAEAPPPLRFVMVGARHVLQRTAELAPAPGRAVPAPMWVPRAAPTGSSPPLRPVAVTPATPQPAARPAPFRPASAPAPEVALEHGMHALVAGKYAVALAHGTEAMDRDPLSPEAAVLTGLACFLDGDASAALGHLRRALVLAPELWQAELHLAMCHERLGNVGEATAAYQRLFAMLSAPARKAQGGGVLAHLEHWRGDALVIARHKLRGPRPRSHDRGG